MLARAPIILVSACLGLVVVLVASSSARALRSDGEVAVPRPPIPVRQQQVASDGAGPALPARPAAARHPPSHRRRRPHALVRVRSARALALRSAPGGSVIGRLAPRTEFGTRRVVLAARREGRWLGVMSEQTGNGRLGWIDGRADGLSRAGTDFSLRADLSRRRVELRHRGRVRAAIEVAVGRPGSPTPTGRFAVTDKLSGRGFGPYYGCCVLALSGRQANTPRGWRGGDRLAIHGTDAPRSLGAASSAGCLRANDRDLRALMRRVPVGTPVTIRR